MYIICTLKFELHTRGRNSKIKFVKFNKRDENEVRNLVENKTPDWSKIRAEYVCGNISLANLADKYGISINTLRKKSASGKWSEAKKKSQNKKAEKIAEKLENEEIKKAVKDIDKVIKSANKLLTKINRAINEVDKVEFISQRESREEKLYVEGKDGKPDVTTTKSTLDMKRKKVKSLIDTRKISDLSKSLLNIKQVLEGKQEDDDNNTGIIFLPKIEIPKPPGDEDTEEVVIHDK